MSSNKSNMFLKNKKIWIIGLVATVVIIAILISIIGSGGDNTDNEQPYFEVAKGPLTINVIEAGTIQAREQIILKSEVEGRTTILSLVPEGTRVNQGDLLIELDASNLEDEKIDQEIRVQNAEAAYIRARENLEVVKNQAKSDVDKATLDYEFAVQDLEKYKEGEFPKNLDEAQSKISLASEEYQRALEKYKWSKVLYNEKYLSQTELQADQLSLNKAKLNYDLAVADLDLLKEYTYVRQIAQLTSDVTQTEMALERTNRKASADVIQAEADLRAKESEYNRQKSKLEKNEEQIAKTKIYAPTDGLVVYATSASFSWRGNVEPLDEGQEIRERQELIYLPTADYFLAEVKIHESSLKKINLGTPAKITVDALPGQVFTGKVAKIAPLPDPQSVFMNPDLKVYETKIHLDGNIKVLKTGMSCKVEIIITKYNDTMYVPVQAVLQVKGIPTVYVIKGNKVIPREVETGLDNNRMIRIISGLEVGEKVLLTPPLEDASIKDHEETDIEESNQQSKPGHPEKGPEQSNPQGMKPGESEMGKPDQGGSSRRPDFQNMTEEQRQEMRKRFENMSPEDREAMRKRFENMSPEERDAMRQGRGGRRPTAPESSTQ